MNNKLVIGILAVLLVMGSLWGQIGHRSTKVAKQELAAAVSQLGKAEGKAANLQKIMEKNREQLAVAQDELVGLQRVGKELEIRLSQKDAAVAVLTREKEDMAAELKRIQSTPAVAVPTNDQGQFDALQKKVYALQKELKARNQKNSPVTGNALESEEKIKNQVARVWIKSEVTSTDPDKLSRAVLQEKLAESASSFRELHEKFAAAEAAADKQKQEIVFLKEELAETKAKVEGTYASRIWIKKELTPVEQEDQVKQELEAKLEQAGSTVRALREKLAAAEQRAQHARELQDKLAQNKSYVNELQKKLAENKSYIDELQEKLTAADDGSRGSTDLQKKLNQMELLVKDLQAKLTAAEQNAQKSIQLQEQVAESESSLTEMRDKYAAAEATIRELQGQLAESEKSIRDLAAKNADFSESKLALEYESVRAQAQGLSLIVEESRRQLDHCKINSDVLLSKITEQNERIHKLKEDNSGLMRDITAMKKKLTKVNM